MTFATSALVRIADFLPPQMKCPGTLCLSWFAICLQAVVYARLYAAHCVICTLEVKPTFALAFWYCCCRPAWNCLKADCLMCGSFSS
ncbi:hypothetical protein V8C86DRAFT_2521178, partial [Haematococcus lacustris]